MPRRPRKICIILIYVKRYGISQSPDSQRRSFAERNIAIFFYLVGSYWLESQLYYIKGLAEVQRRTGEHVGFFYVRTACSMIFPLIDCRLRLNVEHTIGTKQSADTA
jgi:hypothetical protein